MLDFLKVLLSQCPVAPLVFLRAYLDLVIEIKGGIHAYNYSLIISTKL
jgi:hypothetical protein